MAIYLKEVRVYLHKLKWYEILQVPQSENLEADGLARLASGMDEDQLGTVPIEVLIQPSVGDQMVIFTVDADEEITWMTPIFLYLSTGELPTEKNEARRLKYLANRFLIINGKLHKRGYTLPYLRCLDKHEAEYVMREIHEGICGNHSSGKSLSQKALR